MDIADDIGIRIVESLRNTPRWTYPDGSLSKRRIHLTSVAVQRTRFSKKWRITGVYQRSRVARAAVFVNVYREMVAGVGFEPTTFGL